MGDSEDDATALSLAWTDESGAALSLAAEAEADGTVAGSALFAEGAHGVHPRRD